MKSISEQRMQNISQFKITRENRLNFHDAGWIPVHSPTWFSQSFSPLKLPEVTIPNLPTVPTISTGGDEDEPDFEATDVAFVLISTALVWLMIPGLGFFYAGLVREKNALTIMSVCLLSMAIVSIQWYIFGYSLVFSETASAFIGNFDHVFLIGVYNSKSPVSDSLPSYAFCVYQGMFAAITPALVVGSGMERNRIFPLCVFIFLWTTLVYDFLACWTWNSNGFLSQLGGLDFAGGTPVHISSGAAAIAYSLVIRRRMKPSNSNDSFKPHNASMVYLGTGLLYFGWFGFNGGSALSPNLQAVNAYVTTNLSACCGALTWVILDYRHNRKFSAVGFCSGAIAGLVSITPGCGYVDPASSLLIGIIGAIVCHLAVAMKPYACYDDAVDVFEVHGVGGIVGNILTGIFAQKKYDEGIAGGAVDGHWIQIADQIVDTIVGFLWSFVITLIILLIMNRIPALRLRVTEEKEELGTDLAELGTPCYQNLHDMRNALRDEIDQIRQELIIRSDNSLDRPKDSPKPVYTNTYNYNYNFSCSSFPTTKYSQDPGSKFDYCIQQRNQTNPWFLRHDHRYNVFYH